MTFEGFQLSQIDIEDAGAKLSLRVRHGGSGPPLVALMRQFGFDRFDVADYLACTREPGPRLACGGCDAQG